jgi:2-keto-4-pentenoate hydratase/2-oxohepta-3-ene-1,7-dioic acid hydratase in catechol pathway
MIHPVAALIAYVSQFFTLEPGDVLLTGTPAGVGKGQKPPRFLKDGDSVSITIDGIGTLTNPCKISS